MGQKERKVNAQFQLLMALGMLLVVFGHADCSMLDVWGMFPYYSFHMPLFVFISGYFYKTADEAGVGAFLKRKIRHLLVPYFLWNAGYGIFAALLRQVGFTMGEPVSVKTLFLTPFLNGHQFIWNSPAWFVPALFLVQVVNLFIRKAAGLLRLRSEYALTAAYLAFGIFCLRMNDDPILHEKWLVLIRTGYLLFFFQAGHLYRAKLEAKDRLRGVWYFSLLFVIQLGLLYVYVGDISVSAAWMTHFPYGPLLPFVTGLTGIAFWLRVSRMLEPLVHTIRPLRYLGDHTYDVMMHQLTGFLAVKGVIALAAAYTPLIASFDMEQFLTNAEYFFLPHSREQFRLLYVAAGIGFPLAVRQVQDWIGLQLKKRLKDWRLGKV